MFGGGGRRVSGGSNGISNLLLSITDTSVYSGKSGVGKCLQLSVEILEFFMGKQVDSLEFED